MRVKEVMSEGVIGVQEDANLFDAIEIMLKANVSAVFVFNTEGAMVGILSEGDLLHRTELGSAPRQSSWINLFLNGGALARDYAQSHGRRVSDVMTKYIVLINEDADVSEAIDIMMERHFKRLPVERGGNVVGVISRSDILRGLHKAQSLASVIRPDANIRADLEAELASQGWASAGAVHVTVAAGVVTLDGSISDERIRRGLVVMAENVPGVKDVRDQLAWIEPNSGLVMPSENERAN